MAARPSASRRILCLSVCPLLSPSVCLVALLLDCVFFNLFLSAIIDVCPFSSNNNDNNNNSSSSSNDHRLDDDVDGDVGEQEGWGGEGRGKVYCMGSMLSFVLIFRPFSFRFRLLWQMLLRSSDSNSIIIGLALRKRKRSSGRATSTTTTTALAHALLLHTHTHMHTHTSSRNTVFHLLIIRTEKRN